MGYHLLPGLMAARLSVRTENKNISSLEVHQNGITMSNNSDQFVLKHPHTRIQVKWVESFEEYKLVATYRTEI